MSYPIIMNGDHAEFEANWAGDPKDRPDWPLPSFDAKDWAEAFCKIAGELGYRRLTPDGGRVELGVEEGWMIGWFANALMRGFDEHASRIAPSPAPDALGKLVEALESLVEQYNIAGAKVPSSGARQTFMQVERDLRAALRAARGESA